MPELPEVETIRAELAPRLTGRSLVRVEIHDPRLTRPIDLFEVAEELEGDRVVALERRGKYLVLRLESGLALLVHLRMTGSFGFEPTTHVRAVLELDDGTRLAYRDVRRFGTWLVLEDAELDPYLAGKNGPEPLGPRFTADWLANRLALRRAALKAVLLDQRIVAGLGNIYADEALWRARLSPLRPASSLSRDEVRPDGSPGRMQEEFRVYGRDGLPCPRCGTPIAKARVGGRGTSFCPRCQPADEAG
jgi:formamidopyrimidine-DNA glycosylase